MLECLSNIILKYKDKRHFRKDKLERHKIFWDTYKKYSSWSNTDLYFEKAYFEKELTAYQQFFIPFIITMGLNVITLIVNLFITCIIFINNGVISFSAKMGEDKLASTIKKAINDVADLFGFVSDGIVLSFLVLAFLLLLSLIRYIKRREWLQKNLSVINIIIENRKKGNLKGRRRNRVKPEIDIGC